MSIKTISSYDAIVKASTTDRKIVFNLRKTYPAFIILALMLIASFFVMEFIANSIKSDQKLAFEKATNSVISRVEKQVDNILHVQWTLDNLFKNTYVVRDVFELNSDVSVNTYSFIKSINTVTKVKRSYLSEFVFLTRSQGYYDLKIHPETNNDELYIVEYVVPFDKNKERSGFDYKTDEVAFETIEKAITNNAIYLTPVYEFREGIKGFQLVSPIYHRGNPTNSEKERSRFSRGVLVFELMSDDFFTQALGKGVASDSTIHFEIKEIFDSKENIIYYSDNYLRDESHEPLVTDSKAFTFGENHYEIVFENLPNFIGKFESYLPLVALMVSIILSLILFAFIISVITSKERANDIAEKITRSQRRIVDTSSDIIGILDLQGVWKTINNAATSVFKLEPEEIIGQNIKSYYITKVDSTGFSKAIIQTHDEGAYEQLCLMEIQGRKKWMDWKFTISKTDELVYAIGRDVTLEKEAEEQSRIRSKQINLAEHFAKEANVSKTFMIKEINHKVNELLEQNNKDLLKLSNLENLGNDETDVLLSNISEKTNKVQSIIDNLYEKSYLTDLSKKFKIDEIEFISLFRETFNKVDAAYPHCNVTVNLDFSNLDKIYIQADITAIYEALNRLFNIIVPNRIKAIEISALVLKNDFENALEIEILVQNNNELTDIINIYRQYSEDLFEAMLKDDDDYIYNIALAESDLRRMNGTFKMENLDENENVIIITIPINN